MRSEGYLPIDTADSSSSLSHYGRRDFRSRSLACWATLALFLCGLVIFGWTLFWFPNGKEEKKKASNMASTYLSQSPQPKQGFKKTKGIAERETKKKRIQQLSHITEAGSYYYCISPCVRNCIPTTLECVLSCQNRCMEPVSYVFRISKGSRLMKEKMPEREKKSKNLWGRGDINSRLPVKVTTHNNYKESRKVRCVCRTCLLIAKYCSMVTKHWDSPCADDLQQCEIEHCGVDKSCVQVVNDGMKNEPIIATIRVLERCLDVELLHSQTS